MTTNLNDKMSKWYDTTVNKGTLATMAVDAVAIAATGVEETYEGKRYEPSDGDGIYSWRKVGGTWGYYLETGTNSDGDIRTITTKTASPELSTDAAGTTADGELVTVGASSAVSGTFVASFVDLTFVPSAATTLGCYIEIGSAAVAQAGSYYVTANTTYRFGITSGVSIVAALQIVAGGTLYIHPVE